MLWTDLNFKVIITHQEHTYTVKSNPRRAGALLALAAFGASLAPAASAAPAVSGVDPDRGCVYNGQSYFPESEVAEGPACWMTPDDLSTPRLAEVDESKGAADLDEVERTPLVGTDVLNGTVAVRDIQAAPKAENSDEIAANVYNLVAPGFPVKIGANVGGGIHAHDNIPVYVVDSSNPTQAYAEFSSTDPRVTNSPGAVHYNTGKVPVPAGFKPSDGGDHAAAIYDVATGVHREYFGLSGSNEDGWAFASGGYLLGSPDFGPLGLENQALGLMQGSSSVVGMANSLTQISVEDVVSGEIDHAFSMTAPNYAPEPVWPAKQSDGNRTDIPAPQAGMFGRLPADVDIEKWAADFKAEKGRPVDKITLMKMYAAQNHGVPVTDRNGVVWADNFESPYGQGGENKWETDPVAATLMAEYRPGDFPLHLLEWVTPSWVGEPEDYEPSENSVPVPVPDPSTPAPEPTEPGADPTEPTPEPTEPTAPAPEPTEPSTEPTEPGVDPTSPAPEPTEPSTEPSVEPTEPSTEPSTEPTEAGAEPSGEPTQAPTIPAVEPTEPGVEPTEPGVEPTEAGAEPSTEPTSTQAPSAPVKEADEPSEAEVTNAVAEDASPVSESDAPTESFEGGVRVNSAEVNAPSAAMKFGTFLSAALIAGGVLMVRRGLTARKA